MPIPDAYRQKQDSNQLTGPMWAFGGLGTCSRECEQCSEGVLAPPHTTGLPFCLELI